MTIFTNTIGASAANIMQAWENAVPVTERYRVAVIHEIKYAFIFSNGVWNYICNRIR